MMMSNTVIPRYFELPHSRYLFFEVQMPVWKKKKSILWCIWVLCNVVLFVCQGRPAKLHCCFGNVQPHVNKWPVPHYHHQEHQLLLCYHITKISPKHSNFLYCSNGGVWEQPMSRSEIIKADSDNDEVAVVMMHSPAMFKTHVLHLLDILHSKLFQARHLLPQPPSQCKRSYCYS